MDGDVPALDRSDAQVHAALSRGAAIASGGGSSGGPDGPDVLLSPDGQVLAVIAESASADQ